MQLQFEDRLISRQSHWSKARNASAYKFSNSVTLSYTQYWVNELLTIYQNFPKSDILRQSVSIYQCFSPNLLPTSRNCYF